VALIVISKLYVFSVPFKDLLFLKYRHGTSNSLSIQRSEYVSTYLCMHGVGVQEAIQEYFGATSVQCATIMITAVALCAFVYWKSTR